MNAHNGQPGLPRAFISYSWDSESHKDWVRNLADRLLAAGIDVQLDQYEVNLGDDVIHFMEDSIAFADYVVIICTPKYVTRANNRTGGVGIETSLITPGFFEKHKDKKYIPLLRALDDHTGPMPRYLGAVRYSDFRDDADFESRATELIDFIYGRKRPEKPKIGRAPRELALDTTQIDRLRKELKRSARSFAFLRDERQFPYTDGQFMDIISDFRDEFAFCRIIHRDNGKRIIPGRPGITLKAERNAA